MESEAPPSAALYNFLGWLNANKKPVVVGVLVLTLVVGGVFLRNWQKEQTEITAAKALSDIRLPYNAGELPPSGTDAALLKLAATYPQTSAGAHALLLAGSTLFAEGKYALAQEQFDKFIGQHGESRWASHASFGLAASLDAQNKTNDAIAKYEAFIKSYPLDPATDQARLGAARLLEQSGREVQAVELYNKMLETAMKNPKNYNQPAVIESQERLRDLFKKNPALAVQKQPPVKTNTSTFVVPPTPPPAIKTNLATATNAVKFLRTNRQPVLKSNLPVKP